MSNSKQEQFQCSEGHVFEPSVFGAAACPHCGSKDFWPVNQNKSKKWLWIGLVLTGVLGSLVTTAYFTGWLNQDSGQVFLHYQQDPNDKCTFYLEVLQGEDSTKVTSTFFFYGMGREKMRNKTEYCWDEGGGAMFVARAKDPEMHSFIPGGDTLQLTAPGSTKLEDCLCYDSPSTPTTDYCEPCDFDPDNPDYKIESVEFDCAGNTPIFVFTFDRSACSECGLDWYVRSGEQAWKQGNTLDASGIETFDLQATFGKSPTDNPPVDYFENGNAFEVLNCNAKQLPTVADIESDLKTRLNNLRSSTRQESVENFTIPGKGRVVIPADRVKFKRDGRLMSYRKFQNDLMMLGGRVTKVTAKTTSAGYATEVTELQVELK